MATLAGHLNVFEVLNLGLFISYVKVWYLALKWAIRKFTEKIFYHLAASSSKYYCII